VLKNLVLFPFVKEALSSLKNDNWNLFILSNGRQVNQVFKLQHRGIKNLFKAIYTSERIQVEKPNLLAFNFLLQHENLDINETWMI
jgi:haloacid dehalogenase-like hydrolase